ncbi:MAG: gas vesicle protein GvpK, partial [Dolichospermum sp.]
MLSTPADNFDESLTTVSKSKNEAGLAPLLLTVLELLRQLMEAQVIRRMEENLLSESELERAADSIQK